jgi:hypothetical protein
MTWRKLVKVQFAMSCIPSLLQDIFRGVGWAEGGFECSDVEAGSVE